MAVVVLHPQSLSEEQRCKLKMQLVDNFTKLETSEGRKMVSSLHIQFLGQRERGNEEPPVELLGGLESISETLMNGQLKFQISPQSFFQVNAEAAENLYQVCANLAGLKNEKSSAADGQTIDTILFDVCCGTGTIGLCLASRCQKVIGVDCVPEAIENAKNNSRLNGITNTEFHAGKYRCLGQFSASVLPSYLWK